MDKKLEGMKGLAKEVAGGLTGHDDLEEEGRREQARAKAERGEDTDEQPEEVDR
jgi:uncharacterized protein YjbJ (UPF0337 family)